jgi:hypothetical protein
MFNTDRNPRICKDSVPAQGVAARPVRHSSSYKPAVDVSKLPGGSSPIRPADLADAFIKGPLCGAEEQFAPQECRNYRFPIDLLNTFWVS